MISEILQIAEREKIDSSSFSSPLHVCMSGIYQSYIHELPSQASFAIMQDVEKCFLHLLSKELADNAIYAEVGTWLGGSASIVANANPNIQVHCYDPFSSNDSATVQENLHVFKVLGQGQNRSLPAIQKVLAPYPNITLHQVLSPHGVDDIEVDVYFEDGDHANPGLESNLNFWMSKVKEGGYMSIHDYRPWAKGSNITDRNGLNIFWPDIHNNVEKIQANEDWIYLGFVSSMAVFKRRKKRP